MNSIEEIVESTNKNGQIDAYLIGNKNEVYEIMRIALKEKDIPYTYTNKVEMVTYNKSFLLYGNYNLRTKCLQELDL